MRVAKLAIAFTTIASLACGARTELAGQHVDAEAPDANADVVVGDECSTCGGEADSVGNCTTWFVCVNDPLPGHMCNDAPYQVACSCSTGTCTCSHHGTVYKTVTLDHCECQQDVLGKDLFAPLAAIEACGLPI